MRYDGGEKNRDDEELDAFFREHYKGVLSRVSHKVPLDDAEDVTQDVFVQVIRGLSSLRESRKDVYWLRKIERTAVALYYTRYVYRRERNMAALATAYGSPWWGEAPVPNCDRLTALEILELLSARYKEVVRLRMLGLTFPEIGSALCLSSACVKSRYIRGIKEARNLMEVDES